MIIFHIIFSFLHRIKDISLAYAKVAVVDKILNSTGNGIVFNVHDDDVRMLWKFPTHLNQKLKTHRQLILFLNRFLTMFLQLRCQQNERFNQLRKFFPEIVKKWLVNRHPKKKLNCFQIMRTKVKIMGQGILILATIHPRNRTYFCVFFYFYSTCVVHV